MRESHLGMELFLCRPGTGSSLGGPSHEALQICGSFLVCAFSECSGCDGDSPPLLLSPDELGIWFVQDG